jgi:hypothetical protein
LRRGAHERPDQRGILPDSPEQAADLHAQDRRRRDRPEPAEFSWTTSPALAAEGTAEPPSIREGLGELVVAHVLNACAVEPSDRADELGGEVELADFAG